MNSINLTVRDKILPKMKYASFLFLNTLILASTLMGQNPFILGTVDKIQSIELSETRTLNIYLPDGYSADSNLIYPVIYLLDGSQNEDFIHIVGIVQFLTMIQRMPRSIVIGIANVDRRRDFTFPTNNIEDKKKYPSTGGSVRFIAFVEKELQPFIKNKYRTNGFTTIIGQSLGGLLATEILLKKPDLFNNYIIVSPSLWWDDESLLVAAPNLLSKQKDKIIKVYLSVGAEGDKMEGEAKQLVTILQSSERKHLLLTFLPFPEESHLTILHNSVYRGFQILYPKN
jgi:predicted alpha/beta superfamily hydrolase